MTVLYGVLRIDEGMEQGVPKLLCSPRPETRIPFDPNRGNYMVSLNVNGFSLN